MMTTGEVVRSATTGEPAQVVQRRNRVGVWLCIVSDITGTVALLIAYAYLWSLNVNDAWAPPNDTFADPLLFWVITAGSILAALLLWAGYRATARGGHGLPWLVLALLVTLAAFVLQIVQLSTFPFDTGDGAYASATFWLCIGAAYHLVMVLTLAFGVVGRTKTGVINQGNPFHTRLVAMYATWAAIAVLLGALFATTMTTSPNSKFPPMGQFEQPAASTAASTAPAASASPAS